VRKDFGVGIKRKKLRERERERERERDRERLIILRETHEQNIKVIINR